MSSMSSAIPVVHKGDLAEVDIERARDRYLYGEVPDMQIPAHVWVGRFGNYESGHHQGSIVLDWGVPVIGYTSNGDTVFSETVWGRDVYEPDTINKIGGTGAWRPTPPDDAKMQAVIERAQCAVAQAQTRLHATEA